MSRWWAVPIVACAMAGMARPAENYTLVHKGWDEQRQFVILEPIYPLRLGVVPLDVGAKGAAEHDILNCKIRNEAVEIQITGEPGMHNMTRIYLDCGDSEYVALGVIFER